MAYGWRWRRDAKELEAERDRNEGASAAVVPARNVPARNDEIPPHGQQFHLSLLESAHPEPGALVFASAVLLVAAVAAPSTSPTKLPPLPRAPVSATIAVEAPPIYPLKDVKVGQRGTGQTVFASVRGPEPFGFEVLGIMRGFLGPGEDLIIARLIGEQIERTGVISGMSGSPVYIDGKLVGAVGYSFGQFTKDAIAGITPIERMMTGAKAPVSRGANAALADTVWGRAQPIATPLVVDGLHPVVADGFRDLLSARGYGAMTAAGSASGASSSSSSSSPSTDGEGPQRFYASGPIAGLMVDGDFKVAGIGTVTWVKGDRFLAFGHPFLGTGPSQMPVANAEIVLTLASAAHSRKMGQATHVIGHLTDDRLHAIAGTMGELAETVKVTLDLDLPSERKGADALKQAHFQVLRHPTDTPLFIAIATANTLQSRVTAEKGGTFDIAIDATLTTGQRIVLPARIADEVADPAMPAAFAVLGGLSAVLDSDFKEIALDEVHITVTGRPAVERARIVSAQVSGAVLAGETASIMVGLQPWRGPLEQRVLAIKIPRGLKPGTYAVVVASDGAANRVEREGGLRAIPRSLEDELAMFTTLAPPGSLSTYVVRDAASPRRGGAPVPGLPDSLIALTSGGGGVYAGGSTDAHATLVRRDQFPGVIFGEATCRLEVVEE